jgi:hypothetical protein
MEKYQNKEVKTLPESQEKPGPGTPSPCGYVIIYSRILDDFLLLSDTEDQAEILRAQGVEDVIYTVEDIGKLKGLPPESLKAHHAIKKVFPRSKIEKG